VNADNVLTWAEELFLVVFFVLYFGVPALLVWLSYCERFKLDLRDLWTHNNRPDKIAAILLGSWWVWTCSIIMWSLTKTVTTADFLAYGGVWITPLIAKMFAPTGTPPDKPA
jgi:hypothetical protein